MFKASLLADELALEYSQNHHKQFPKIVWKAPTHGIGESYFANFEKGVIQVQAESPLAAAYGIAQLKVAVASNHLGDFVGASKPRFPLMPLWIGCEIYKTSNGIEVALPRCMGVSYDSAQRKENAERLCRRIIELGYNTILLGNNDFTQPTFNSNVLVELEGFIQLAQAFGLKVIVKSCLFLSDASQKITRCPLCPSFRGHVIEHIHFLLTSVPSLNYFFWESSLLCTEFTSHIFARDATLSELVIKELQLLESALGARSQLIYYIPSPDSETAQQHAVWMSHLCDEAKKYTIIAFSAVAGDCYADHLSPHPFWEKLRKSPDISATQLLPLVNIGLISQGEGLWPTPVIDLLGKYYSRLYRHSFAGVLTLTNALPQQGGILDCNLWIAAQTLWRNLPPQQITETWFAAFRPDWHFEESGDVLQRVRQLAVKLSFLRSQTFKTNNTIIVEDCRIITDHILTSLRDIKICIEKIERKQIKKKEKPTLNDYLQVFSRDAQHIVLHFLQSFNLSFPYTLEEGELKESFWTQLSPGSGQGIRSASKIAFFNEPRRGLPGSAMEAIYLENRYL